MSQALTQERETLYNLLDANILRGEVKLSSGKISNFYIDGKLVSLTSAGLHAAASHFLQWSLENKITAVGGMTLGADPLIGAVLALAQLKGATLKGFIVRKEPKGHGTGKQIEGPALTPQDNVCILEDIVTTGGSAMKSIEAVRRESDANVCLVLTLVDREEGGAATFAQAGIPFKAIFKKSDFKI